MTEAFIQVERINMVQKKGPIKAFASVKLGGMFVVKNLRIIEGRKGLFVAMPSESYTDKASQEKKYTDIVFPVNREVFRKLQHLVLDAYQNHSQESGADTKPTGVRPERSV